MITPLKVAGARALAVLTPQSRARIMSALLVSVVVVGMSGLFTVEIAQHVEQRVLRKIEQKLVDKLAHKLSSRIDEFKARLRQRWQEVRAAWRSRLSQFGERLAASWQSQAREIETEAGAGDLSRFPGGIPPDELVTARASVVDAADTVNGAPAPDPTTELPSQIRFDSRDADRGGAGPGEGNLADRLPEPDTDTGNHASELPNVGAEIDAVRSLCRQHPDCPANPAADPELNTIQEQLRLSRCCRVVEAPGVTVIPVDMVGGGDGIPADVVPGASELPPIEPAAGGGGVGGAPDVTTGSADLTSQAGPAACDLQCQTLIALVEATVHVLSDFDQTKHGPGNQEGVGQLLPHIANQQDRCVDMAPGTAAGSFDNDLRAIGCELAIDLGSSGGDVRRAFAMYVRRNHLPPLDAAWPGEELPAPGPRVADPRCPAGHAAVPAGWTAALGGEMESDFMSLTVSADCGRARLATASLLTAVSRIYFDWNTDPSSMMDGNAFDSGGAGPRAAPDGPNAPNHAAQVAGAAAYNAGFRGHDLLLATAVAGAASGWNPSSTAAGADGHLRVGLWRIPVDPRRGWSETALLDSDANARARVRTQ